MYHEKIVVLDNVRSGHNVGSIFRTSDGAGVSRMILLGYTPGPVDRFGRMHTEIAKTSLGASATVPWERQESQEDGIERVSELKEKGYAIVSVEQSEKSVSLSDFTLPERGVYIFGNELDGVSKELMELSDMIVEIPMLGKKESLNVGVVAGIILFHK